MKRKNSLSRQILVGCLAFAVALWLFVGAAGMFVMREGATPQGLLASLAGELLLTAAFLALMNAWLKQRIDKPLQRLEQAVRGFGEKSRNRKDSDALVMSRPDIHTGDELEDLADALVDTSKNLKTYVENLLSSAVKMETMQQEINRINDVAQRDALTGVRNRGAFDRHLARLDLEISNGVADFGLLIANVDDLDRIHETCGRDKGDLYLQRACKLICDTFVHSPVYRVGEDAFAVVLEKIDLASRTVLLERFRRGMRDDGYLQAWERVSMSFGFAIFNSSMDESTKSVLDRAEKAMQGNRKRAEPPHGADAPQRDKP